MTGMSVLTEMTDTAPVLARLAFRGTANAIATEP
jgi:hypothetical protein